MTFITFKYSSYDEYIRTEGNPSISDTEERNLILKNFPFPIVLLLSFPELDFANRWCRNKFGLRHGRCHDYQSEYPICKDTSDHSHVGIWTDFWLQKIEYNYGYNEWYFSKIEYLYLFTEFIPNINWGEIFPRK